MATFIPGIVAAVRAVPETIVRGLDRWVLRQHAPIDVHGDGSECICRTCMTEWPCPDVLRVSDRVVS